MFGYSQRQWNIFWNYSDLFLKVEYYVFCMEIDKMKIKGLVLGRFTIFFMDNNYYYKSEIHTYVIYIEFSKISLILHVRMSFEICLPRWGLLFIKKLILNILYYKFIEKSRFFLKTRIFHVFFSRSLVPVSYRILSFFLQDQFFSVNGVW